MKYKKRGGGGGQGDHTLFIKHLVSKVVATLLVYGDDIIVIGSDPKEKEALQ